MASNILTNVDKKMKAVSEGLTQELATIRTGRASPALIEHLKVEYAGAPIPLNQIAGISAPEARLLVIQPWDPGSLRNIEQAILKSDLGLNPVNDGRLIRLSIPQLSEERRQPSVPERSRSSSQARKSSQVETLAEGMMASSCW